MNNEFFSIRFATSDIGAWRQFERRNIHDSLFSILFICCFKTRLIYCDRERSSYSAFSFNFTKISLSIVMLIFSFKGFNIITS